MQSTCFSRRYLSAGNMLTVSTNNHLSLNLSSQGAKLSPKLFNLLMIYPNIYIPIRLYLLMIPVIFRSITTSVMQFWRKLSTLSYSLLGSPRGEYKTAINNTNLPWSNQCKYFGVTCDQSLTF